MNGTMRTALACVAAAAALAGCGGSSGPHGFYDMGKLSASLQVKLDARLIGQLQSVTNINCFRAGAQGAKCYAKASDGSTAVLDVTISPSGGEYVVQR